MKGRLLKCQKVQHFYHCRGNACRISKRPIHESHDGNNFNLVFHSPNSLVLAQKKDDEDDAGNDDDDVDLHIPTP